MDNIMDLPKVPSIKIEKSNKKAFTEVKWRELGFASLDSNDNYDVYSIVYPACIWGETQKLQCYKMFNEGKKNYYAVYEKLKVLTNDPLARDDEMCSYFSIDNDDMSYCRAIHERFNTQNPEIAYYKDGPEHHLLKDSQMWDNQSLVYENNQYVLDIKCVSSVTAGWTVSINNNRYDCLEIFKFAIPYRGTPLLPLEPEFINKHYINKDGHCVLVRRYMGPVWKNWRKEFWEELQQGEYIEEKGHRFYLYMDYVPKVFL